MTEITDPKRTSLERTLDQHTRRRSPLRLRTAVRARPRITSHNETEDSMAIAVDTTDRRPAIGQRRQRAIEQKFILGQQAEAVLPQLEANLSAANARQAEIGGDRKAIEAWVRPLRTVSEAALPAA